MMAIKVLFITNPTTVKLDLRLCAKIEISHQYLTPHPVCRPCKDSVPTDPSSITGQKNDKQPVDQYSDLIWGETGQGITNTGTYHLYAI